MKRFVLKFRLWVLNQMFWHEAKMALRSEQYAAHLLRAAALLQKRQQILNQA